MSKGAYENYFQQAAPAGAVFGVDMSWYQASADGYDVDHSTCLGYWLDVHTWAYFANIRSSYGGSGDDGAQALHMQVADELGYTGKRGMYHFIHAQAGVVANFNNFMRRSEPYADRLTHYMADYEASPNAGADFIKEFCDRVEQARQKPTFNYGGKGYMDAAGFVNCPAKQLWVAHYPPRGSNAWAPTTDWSSWDAPLMPDQYAGQYPGCWQWQSLTPEHGHLDLNISTTPEMFGGEFTPPPGEDDFMSALSPEQQFNMANRIDAIFNAMWENTTEGTPRWASEEARLNALYFELVAKGIPANTARVAAIAERMNTDTYLHSTGHEGDTVNLYDELWKLVKSPTAAVDVAKLAKELAPLLPDNVDEKLLSEAFFKLYRDQLSK